MEHYPWLVFLHVLSVLIFTLGHGASAAVLLRLRAETDPVRLGALLDLSRWSLNIAGLGLLGALITGIAAGVIGSWLGTGWFWASLALFLVVGGLMTPLGRGYLDQVRQGLGVATGNRKKDAAAAPVLAPGELAVVLRSSRPLVISAVGVSGLAVLLWLMMFKPF